MSVYLVERRQFDTMEDQMESAAYFKPVGYVSDPAKVPNRLVTKDEAGWTFDYLMHREFYRITLLQEFKP